jgi:hypothetical protein
MTDKKTELTLLKKLLAEKEKQLKNETNKEKVIQKYNDFEFNDLSDTEDLESGTQLYCKIGEKNKTICVYGLHRKLPVSLKPFQWELLYQFMMSGELHKFIKENEGKLK